MRSSTTLVSMLVLCFAILLVVLPGAEARCGCRQGQRCDNNGACQNCQQGEVSFGGSVTQCTRCDANYYAPDGSATCTPCPAGKGSQAGSRECQPCQDGFSSEEGKGCKQCQAGYISKRGDTSCRACDPGTYANGARTFCQECSAGSFQDLAGQTECKKCPRGYWQEKQKKTYCDICPCGTWNDREGATKCDTCGNQQPVSDAGATSRNQCFNTPAGSFTNQQGCAAQCPAGTFSNQQGTRTCTNCGPNAVAQPGSTTCATCPVGKAPDSTKASCTPTSTYRPNGKRAPAPAMCPPGHKACAVKSGQRNWFECVDVSSDLTSCGGCRSDFDGEDCTAFDPLASAACVKGKCEYACPKGYALTVLGCERAGPLQTRVY